jgi:hypothetical protein
MQQSQSIFSRDLLVTFPHPPKRTNGFTEPSHGPRDYRIRPSKKKLVGRPAHGDPAKK